MARIVRFDVLDGLRGVCALVVALYHLNVYGHFYDVALLRNSWLFVDFFFVLSGFVISHAYMERLGGWRNVRGFVIRRLGRLWPLHIAVLMFLVGLELAKIGIEALTAIAPNNPAFSGDNTLPALVANVLLIQSMDLDGRCTWNFPSWSISTEFYTYVVFAGIFLLARRSVQSLALAFLTGLLGAAMVMLLSKHGMQTECNFGFFRCLFGFFVGHLTYRLWKAANRKEASASMWLAEAAAVVLIATFVATLGQTAWAYAAPFVFGFAVWVFAHEGGPISRLVKLRPIMLIGAWSYSIYMVHSLIYALFNGGASYLGKIGISVQIEKTFSWSKGPVELLYHGDKWSMDGLAVVYLLLVTALAAFTYRRIEQPGRRFFNSLPWARLTHDPARGRRRVTAGARRTDGRSILTAGRKPVP